MISTNVHAPFSILKKNDDDYRKENILKCNTAKLLREVLSGVMCLTEANCLLDLTSHRDVGSTWAAWGVGVSI
jgi:hypothetical protein